MDPLAARVLSDKAECFYDGVRLNPLAIYCAVRTAIEALNAQRTADGLPVIKAPSESTVRRYLQRHLDYRPRHPPAMAGAKVAGASTRSEARCRRRTSWTWPSSTRRSSTGAVIDDEHMINVGRPWLAVMIDVKSRYPWAFTELRAAQRRDGAGLPAPRRAPQDGACSGASGGERRLAEPLACPTPWWWTTPGRTPAARLRDACADGQHLAGLRAGGHP